MARLEGAYEQMSDLLSGIDGRLNGIEAGMDRRFDATDRRFDAMDRRFDAMDQKFLWVIGLVLVSILLPLVQRFVPHG